MAADAPDTLAADRDCPVEAVADLREEVDTADRRAAESSQRDLRR
jgi:hypothetical protein